MTDGNDGVRNVHRRSERALPAARRSGRFHFAPPRSFRRDEPDAAQRYRAQSGRGQIFLQFGWYHGAFQTVFVPLLGRRLFFILAPVIKISRPEEDAGKTTRRDTVMQWTGLNELREKYLSFFEGKGHLRLDSFGRSLWAASRVFLTPSLPSVIIHLSAQKDKLSLCVQFRL